MTYDLTRFVFQRALAVIYFVAFLIVVNQFRALCGAHGLSPVPIYLRRLRFFESPSLFFLNDSDGFMMAFAWLGLLLSFCAVIGITEWFTSWVSMAAWFALWAIYMSFVNAGQQFYGFGWEILLLETGFLAIFLGARDVPASVIMMWLLRWVLFRVMFGAGLIKIRGDSCWWDLTCMHYHYETQPLPGPLSWYFHRLPDVIQRFSVLFNHFIELVVPFGFFAPRPFRITTGLLTILFQTILIASGNLSWLNCLTIVLCISCLDDRFFESLFRMVSSAPSGAGLPQIVYVGLACVIGLLSIQPVLNLVSRGQIMNTSFDPFRLVNTYGAFGSVTRERQELIIEGTDDEVVTPQSKWLEYGFKGKPGDLARRPPQVTPYHYKIDWQMWFAAMSSYYRHPWLLNLIAKLLAGQPDVIALLGYNPFPDKPPKHIRVVRYIYRFTDPGEKNWWKREFTDVYLPPLSLEDPQFRDVLRAQGWLD